MTVAADFSLQITQVDGYEFRVRFDKEHYAELTMDEPPPLGLDSAPNPARILAAAIGNCLSASLVFCLGRKSVIVQGLRADVKVELVRNAQRRLRIGRIDVRIQPATPLPEDALADCLATFEEFCVVTQSVREGLDVRVEVLPAPALAGDAP
jgi:uncharacterized OsmC-like protein